MDKVDKHIIIGTAGHIDHGKTTLITALTGKSTDRLKEEKQRGISIDLGFGYFDSPSGNRYGIVDVPGHERFINNMVAGVVGMDLILLVIAADEGIMPQTKEHMDILELLGVDKAIVVLNKIDLVDKDWSDLVETDIKDQLQNTFLKNTPIVKVSSTTGEGLDALIEQIDKIVDTDVVERNSQSISCLPVDRVFTITGSGTIVTGTLISGQIDVGDDLELVPIGKTAKIRSIQIHNKAANSAFAGQRVALNLAGLAKDEIYRGCVVAAKDSIHPTNHIDVRLNILKTTDRSVKNGSRLHFFSGTTEVLCKLILLDTDELNAGHSALAQLRFDKKIAIKRGDRFVVRFYSPLETIGGGIVVEANAKKIKRFDQIEIDKLLRIENGSIEENILSYIDDEDEPVLNCDDLAKMCACTKDEVYDAVEKLSNDDLITVYDLQNSKIVWSNKNKEHLINTIAQKLNEFHKKNIYKFGIYKAEIQNNYFKHTKKLIFDLVIEDLSNLKIIKCNNEYISDYGFDLKKDKTYTSIENTLLKCLDEARFNFTWFSDIEFKDCKKEDIDDVCASLINEGKIIKVDENLYTLPKYIDEAQDKIIDVLKINKRITIAEVRDILNTTRKTAKPILEYMDILGITRKTGGESEREIGNVEADG